MSTRFLGLGLALLFACGSSKPQTTVPAPVPTAPDVAVAPPSSPPVNPDAAPIPLWPEVKKGTLPNGLTYYIYKHGKPEKRALLWLAVNAGSVQEDDDQRGLAHFDEHMAFNGTKRYPKNALISYLEKIGMRFGADLNAYTTWDQTVYQLEVPTDDAQYIAGGLDILRDWAGDVTYDPSEVGVAGKGDKERGVVLEEWRLGRGAGRRLYDKQAKVLFAGTRYADRLTIGDPDIIKNAPRDNLYRFYKDWYRPDLMAVIAVGDFDPADIEKQIVARFSDLKGPAKERPRPTGGFPKGGGTRVSIETDKEASSTSVTVANLVPHRDVTSKLDHRRLLAERLYSNILDERLHTISRKPDAPFIRAFGSVSPMERDIDAFERVAEVKSGKVEDSLRALMTEVLRIERNGITAGELERARTNMARTYEELADTEATRDSRQFTDEITRNFFVREFMVGSAVEREMALAVIPTITVDDLNAVVKTFGGADNRVVLISGPDGQPLPTKEQVLAIIDDVSKAQIPQWEDKPIPTSLLATLPTPGKIVKEKKVDAVGVTEWTLSNGAHVIVKPTDFERDSVEIEGFSAGGEATISDKDYPSDRFADDVVNVSGLGAFDAETLGKVLTGKQVYAQTSIDESVDTVVAGGSARDLESAMQLLYMRMTAPRSDAEAFAVWQRNSAERIANQLRSPEARYSRESAAALYKNNLRHVQPEPTELAKVDAAKALGFYAQQFGDASSFTFVIVGAVELDKLRPLVETYLASLPAKGRKAKEIDLGIRKVGGVVKKEWKLGQEPKASVRIDFHGDETWTRDKERDMNILGQVLSMRLRDVLREDMGGVYGVRANGSITRSPHQERSFVIQFGCDPTRVDELTKAAYAQIAEIAANGTTKLTKDGEPVDYLEKVKQTFLRARETEMRKNSFWIGWLTKAYKYGDDPAMILDPSKVVARMTSDNVKAAAKRFLDPKQTYTAVMLPEKDAPAPAPAVKP